MTIEEKMKKARFKFVQKDLAFFGICLYKFTWVLQDLGNYAEAMVMFNVKDLGKLYVGNIFFNKNLVSKPDYTYNNLVFVAIHELLHILHMHGIRKGSRDPKLWNVATDHVIERDLKNKMSNFAHPYENSYNIVADLDRELPNCTAEEGYEWLMKKIKNKQYKVSFNEQTGRIDVHDSNGNLVVSVDPDLADMTPTGDANDPIMQQIKQYISQIRAIHENMKQRGMMSGEMSSYLDELLEVEIPWNHVVEKAIKNSVIMRPIRRTWKNPNKYYRALKINGRQLLLPGRANEEDSGAVGTLYVLTDDSGSVGDDNLKEFSHIILKAMDYFKNIVLMVHDVELQQEKQFDKSNVHLFYEFIKKEGYKGRGGTSHRYVFDRIEEEFKDDADKISMVISLTDMGSDIESIYKDYSWIKNNTPLMFIRPQGCHEISLDPKFGKIYQIEINSPK